MEFRHPSWYDAGVQQRLAASRVAFCIHDMADSASPAWQTSPVVYLRLHGPTTLKYQGRYDSTRLQLLAQQVREFTRSARLVCVFFNNSVAGAAAADALQLRALLAATDASPADPRSTAR